MLAYIGRFVKKVDVQVAHLSLVFRREGAGYGFRLRDGNGERDAERIGARRPVPVGKTGARAPERPQRTRENDKRIFHNRYSLNEKVRGAEDGPCPERVRYCPRFTDCVTGVSQSATEIETDNSLPVSPSIRACTR